MNEILVSKKCPQNFTVKMHPFKTLIKTYKGHAKFINQSHEKWISSSLYWGSGPVMTASMSTTTTDRVIVAKSVNFLNLLDSFFSDMSFRRKSHVYEHPTNVMAVVEFLNMPDKR